jgi:hypothetical protein
VWYSNSICSGIRFSFRIFLLVAGLQGHDEVVSLQKNLCECDYVASPCEHIGTTNYYSLEIIFLHNLFNLICIYMSKNFFIRRYIYMSV